ncbi:DUF1599 domain-containing protein [Moheibacter stercoris]|uniref:Nucleotide modification associated domain-containing protein n=1 Tax=Moheibacter stercoris TaxID=1628251 RepID=A0ABV2LVX6_9FLAO
MENTLNQFQAVIGVCKSLFEKKLKDYGPAWRILRMPSLTDQIYIKVARIRSLQEKEVQKIDEGQESEFIGIINYSIIALIQLELGIADQLDISNEKAIELYSHKAELAQQLMMDKNHDYGEAWRDMRVSSITDMILQKVLRVKQIEDNKGKLLVSEGLDANYLDMVNYAVFALILLGEDKS